MGGSRGEPGRGNAVSPLHVQLVWRWPGDDMSESLRLYKYQQLLGAGRPVSRARLMEATEVSLATFKRDVAKLRDQFGVPIVFDRDRGGYVLQQQDTVRELPGFWLSQEELLALATIQKMLEQLAPTLLGPQLQPLEARLNTLLARNGLGASELHRRVRLMTTGKRRINGKVFETVALATFERKRLGLQHFSRSRAEENERTVSPIDIALYRGNWYLNAWCHWRNDVRRFSIDAVAHATVLDEPALEVDEATAQRALGAGYGIFAGRHVKRAVLWFSPERARWVQSEDWHPDQVGQLRADGSYQLELPYTDERELLGDVMRYGAGVEVLAPAELRQAMKKALHEAMGRYL